MLYRVIKKANVPIDINEQRNFRIRVSEHMVSTFVPLCPGLKLEAWLILPSIMRTIKKPSILRVANAVVVFEE